VSPTTLLVALLVVAYVGSILAGGRAIRGYGLPSGAEYVLLGFAVGPHVLGIIDRSTVGTFAPIATVALGWLALVVGLDYGYVGPRRVRARGLIAGIVLAFVAFIAVGAVVWIVALGTGWRGGELWLLAVGVGAVCSETTRHAVRWVVERHGARGPLSELAADIADADDLVPLLVLAVLFAVGPGASPAFPLSGWAWALITVGLGLLLGATVAALLGRQLGLGEGWSVILGASLFGVGIATMLGLSALTTMFFLGVAISVLSPHRHQLRSMMEKTERPVLLPALLLAGAHVDLRAAPDLGYIVSAALVARFAVKALTGAAVARVASPRSAQASLWFGIGTLSCGALTMAIGLAFALRFDRPLGGTVLAAAAAATVLGELLGPLALRRALRQAGEIGDESVLQDVREAPPA
jgi:Kef-type K+ transport system membrane component KefB